MTCDTNASLVRKLHHLHTVDTAATQVCVAFDLRCCSGRQSLNYIVLPTRCTLLSAGDTQALIYGKLKGKQSAKHPADIEFISGGKIQSMRPK